ncbi:MAG: non-ribosomal peptide synthetase, partial [bacterium]
MAVQHGGLRNFLLSMQAAPGFGGEETLLSVTTVSFDIFGLEAYLPLVSGGRLALASSGAAADPAALRALLAAHGVTAMQATPATWRMLIDGGWTGSAGLKMLVGGEALPGALAREMLRRGGALWNLYGPTETTIWSSIRPVAEEDGAAATVSIGRPIANTRFYVLDGQQRPAPIGVPGELHIGGDGLARGYLNRPELTAEKFIEVDLAKMLPDPVGGGLPPSFSVRHEESQNLAAKAAPTAFRERLYKTGDLVRYRQDGDVEFLGRLDHQVKIRGYRIELGEIEAALCAQEGVREAVVVALGEGVERQLAAYVTGEAGLDGAGLREALKAGLPAYMVPSAIVVLERLPLTPNGKIDRRSLPEPGCPASGAADLPLQSGSEHQLAALWSALLRREVNSRAAQFFDLGGHSLLATRLVSRIRDHFGIGMPLRVLFEHPVLGDLAAWLDRQQREGTLRIAVTPESAPRVLSHAQQRLWFLAQLEGESATYNMPAAVRLRGTLDLPALRQTFIRLDARHESLRLCFPECDGEPALQVRAPGDPLEVYDLSPLPEAEREAELQRRVLAHAARPFDLQNGPLLRLELLILDGDTQVLMFNMHHIISDGWSMGVLLREWRDLYGAQRRGEDAELPALPIQYADYAAWQRQWLQGERLREQLEYWNGQLSGAPQLLELPADFARPAVQSHRGAHLQSRLPAGLSRQIKHLSQQQGCTLFMTMLAAFNLLLSRYSGQDDLLVGTPIANRTHSQTENLIGLFVNTLVLRTRIAEQDSFISLLAQVRENALGAYAHQDVPFESLVEALNPPRSLGHSPLFQVMFGLQNATEDILAMPGLEVSVLPSPHVISKFDLTLGVNECEEGLVCGWEYGTALFDAATIQRMAAHFEILLQQLVAAPAAPLAAHSLLSAPERAQLSAWNATAFPVPDIPVHQLFEEQVKRTPQAQAVVFA